MSIHLSWLGWCIKCSARLILQDGRPVYIEILGKIDVNKLYQVTTQERQLQRLVVEYERFLRERRVPSCLKFESLADEGLSTLQPTRLFRSHRSAH